MGLDVSLGDAVEKGLCASGKEHCFSNHWTHGLITVVAELHRLAWGWYRVN